MCTVLLPPCDNPIAVNKYIIYQHYGGEFCILKGVKEVVFHVFEQYLGFSLILWNTIKKTVSEPENMQRRSRVPFIRIWGFVLLN